MSFILLLGAALLVKDATSFTIDGVAAPTSDGMIPLSVATGDLDGDGAADRGTLLIRCAGDSVTEAMWLNVKSPRDSTSGLATGKRTHIMPHVFEPAGSRLAAMRGTWDLKEAKGARIVGKKGYDYYHALSLGNVAGLCAAALAQAATVKATKSRSNIQNN
nr:hypothetical protein [uncultured Sphingomonas sp.]